LQVSPSYRQAFERAVLKVLERQGWQIVRTTRPRGRAAAT
jgi:Holliday junction resolvase